MKYVGILYRGLGFLGLVGLWQTLSLVVGEFFFPSPLRVFTIVWNLVATGDFVGPTSITLMRVTLGMSLAIVLGSLIGFLTGSRKLMDSLIGPLLVVFMLTPSLLMVFLSIFSLGFYDYVPSLAAAVVHAPFSAVVVRAALLNPPIDKLEMAHVYGASSGLIIRDIYIPYLIPTITSETRVAYSHAWKITLLAEVFGFSSGAGYMVKIYFASLDIARVMAWALVVIVAVLAIEEAIRFLEKRFSKWRARS